MRNEINTNVIAIPSSGQSFEDHFLKGRPNDITITKNQEVTLSNLFKKEGIQIVSLYENSEDVEAVLFFSNAPYKVLSKVKDKNWIYVAEEPEVVRPANAPFFLRRMANHFDYILSTSNASFKENNIFSLNTPTHLDVNVEENLLFDNRKLACMVATRYESLHPKAQYYLRDIVAAYFNEKDENFGLFGNGWGKYKKINKGHAKSKKEVYALYRFAFAFNNNKDVICADKLFDCFCDGIVPIAASPGNEFPKDSYIDFDDFKNMDELYQYLKLMPEHIWNKYIEQGQAFLISKDAEAFDVKTFVKTISKVIRLPRGKKKTCWNIFMIRASMIIARILSVKYQKNKLKFIRKMIGIAFGNKN